MNRESTTLPIETWRFYNACLYNLTMTFLSKVYCGVKSDTCPQCKKKISLKTCPHCKKKVPPNYRERQIQRWAADPATTQSNQRNPVDRYETLLKELMARGWTAIARAIVRRQADIVGCFLVEKDIPVSDKKSMAEECLDDIPALAEFHRVLNDPDSSPEEVREALAAVEQELRENYDRFCRDRGILA